LAKNEKAAANVRPTAPDAQSQDVIRDPAGTKLKETGEHTSFPPTLRPQLPTLAGGL